MKRWRVVSATQISTLGSTAGIASDVWLYQKVYTQGFGFIEGTAFRGVASPKVARR